MFILKKLVLVKAGLNCMNICPHKLMPLDLGGLKPARQ
jgi:hypothetical protein